MREIGGYFELERFTGEHYHKDAIPLNCGRGCLKYLAELRGIKSIWMPDYMCDSVVRVFVSIGATVKIYRINSAFLPVYDFEVKEDEWMLICDYYGQLRDKDIAFALEYSNEHLICDETENFFRKPYAGTDTLYTCRKWFGVADGAYLYTGDGGKLDRHLPIDSSHNRMSFILGRFEVGATEYFNEAKKNNEFFDSEEVKQMSPLTDNILRALDYETIKRKRRENWDIVSYKLSKCNLISPKKPDVPFMYPLLLDNTDGLREGLANYGIYIPLLWPNVEDYEKKESSAYRLSRCIMPLPIDQRYDRVDMDIMCVQIERLLRVND